MTGFNVNLNVLRYFLISWLSALLMTGAWLKSWDDALLLLAFMNLINSVIHLLVWIQLIILYATFVENRRQFLNSIILLMFNFPVVTLFSGAAILLI